ncbi:hypothetical protein [Arthrobacter sp. ISL-65]|uniref:hypothetical protein n=1 Tax=Arthrobacter sp. ISL-65 TaxID=2819112 RepID=UPI001BE83BD5|nr:hypothetical protein [Arthrobacter sp. ISL-65]MBT2551116.1 hypothetical protein [Arthrobacter sp. ISL-65]
MFTLTINQTDSRRDGDRVPHLLKDLRHIPARLDFDRSVEDEVQGIVDCPHQAVDAALIALRCGSWYVGIGVGPVNEPLPNQIKDASGHGLIYARRAVDRLRNSKERIPVAVEGPLTEVAAESESVLRLLGHIVRDRSDAEWRVLDLMTPGVRGQQKTVAAELGITSQAVSKAVARSQWNEEHAARPAAARLLSMILDVR